MPENNSTRSQKSAPTVGIYTLGCRVNQYESDAIAEIFTESGYLVLPFEHFCDVYIINTCTVTAESDRKSRQFVRRAKKQNADALIVVTGCLPQTAPDKIVSIDGVDIICGNGNKTQIPSLIAEYQSSSNEMQTAHIAVSDISSAPFEKMSVKYSSKTRAYIKIEDGCESRCAYCIIPAARGSVRSKPREDVIAEIEYLADHGCKEVVLTGIETASYGKDFTNGYNLANLLEDINSINGIERIRLGSLDPSVMNENFASKIAKLTKIMPHFHLSMQSGSTRILNLMRRKYTADTALENITRLRELVPDITFTTDIMTGFPGETDQDFEETLEFCRKAQFLSIHIFTYSKRKGTEAEKMINQVPEQTKRARSAQLAEQTKQIKKSIIQNYIDKNSTAEVLFEQTENGKATGHTRNFIETTVETTNDLEGKIKQVIHLTTDGNEIKAKLKM